MNNIKKSLCLILSFLLVICCVILTACKPETPDNTEPSSASDTQATSTAVTEPVTTEASAPAITLSDSYLPTKAYDDNGDEISVYTVYGSSFRDNGGYLCFKEDGTFTTFIGVFGNVNNESGTYKVISETEIEMVFNNDKTETAVVTQVDSDGNVTELKMPHRGFQVVFTQK